MCFNHPKSSHSCTVYHNTCFYPPSNDQDILAFEKSISGCWRFPSERGVFPMAEVQRQPFLSTEQHKDTIHEIQQDKKKTSGQRIQRSVRLKCPRRATQLQAAQTERPTQRIPANLAALALQGTNRTRTTDYNVIDRPAWREQQKNFAQLALGT